MYRLLISVCKVLTQDPTGKYLNLHSSGVLSNSTHTRSNMCISLVTIETTISLYTNKAAVFHFSFIILEGDDEKLNSTIEASTKRFPS